MKNIALLLICLLIMAVQAESQINYDSVSGILPLQEGKAMATNSIAAYPNIRLTIDPAESKNPRVEVDVNYVYVVWQDNRDGNWEIYWQKFDRSNGQAITDPIRVTSTSNTSREPAIGIDGIGNSYLVWEEAPNLYGTIYAAKIDPDGLIIVSPMAVSSSHSIHSDIATDAAGNNWITYHRMAPSDQNVYLRKSNNTFVQLCSTNWNKGTIPGMDKQPVVTNTGSYVIVAWRDLKPFFQDAVFARIFNLNCGPLAEVSADGDYRDPAVTGVGNLFFVTFQQAGRIYNLLDQNSVCQINDVNGTGTLPTVATDGDWGWFAWQDSRDGNSEIYSTNAYGCDQFVDERFTENPATSVKPDIAALPSEPGKNWTVWQDNRDGNWEIYLTSTEFVSPSGPPSFVIYDGAGEFVQNTPCRVSKVNTTGTIELQYPFVTDENGVLLVESVWFDPGDRVRVEVLSHSKLAPRHDQEITIDGQLYGLNAHNIYISNAQMTQDAEFTYDPFLDVPEQPIYLNHTLVRYNLTVCLEWDTDYAEYIQSLETGLRYVSNYLYDVTNGQCLLDTIAIYDRGFKDVTDENSLGHWQRADIQINASNDNGIASVSGKKGKSIYTPLHDGVENTHINLPRMIFSDIWKINAIKSVEEYPYQWNIDYVEYNSLLYEDEDYFYPSVRGLAHELGHYLFNLLEEYKCWCDVCVDSEGNIGTWAACNDGINFGLMDHVIRDNDEMNSEMSSATDYIDYSGTNMQFIKQEGSAWEMFELFYTGGKDVQNHYMWGGPNRNISTPEEVSSVIPIIGPNNDLENPDIDVGAEMTFIYEDWVLQKLSMSDKLIEVKYYDGGKAKFSNLYLHKQESSANSPGGLIDEGFTDDKGKAYLLGYDCNDILRVYKNENGSIHGNLINDICALRTDTATTEIVLDYIPNPNTFVPSVELLDGNVTNFSINCASEFSQTPVFEISQGNVLTWLMLQAGTNYSIDFTSPTITSGLFTLTELNTEGQGYFVPMPYRYKNAIGTDSLSELALNDGSFVLDINSMAAVISAVVVKCDYPVQSIGEKATKRQVAPVYAFDCYPQSGFIGNSSMLYIQYDGFSLANNLVSQMRIHRWDESMETWTPMESTVDTGSNYVIAAVNEVGAYTIFVPGEDVSGLGSIEPDPMYWFFNNAVSPTSAVVYVGDFDIRTVSEIDPGTIFVNGTITLDSFVVVSDYPGFSGPALACYFDMADFVSQYGLLWDTTIQTYDVSGQFDDGMPFMIEGDITLIGHTSGDLNNDGEVNINDLTLMVGFLFRGADLPCEESVADVNHDGIVNVTDLIWLVSNIFGS